MASGDDADRMREARLGPTVGATVTTGRPPLFAQLLTFIFSFFPVLAAILILMAQNGAGKQVLMILGSLVLVMVVIPGVAWGFRRAQVQLHRSGLVVSRGFSTKLMLFDEVTSLVLHEKDLLQNGVPKGVRRRLVLRRPGGSVRLWDVATPTRNDAARLIESAVLGVGQSAERSVAAGGALRGKKWALDATGLRFGRSQWPLDAISRVATLQGRIWGWTDKPEPEFSIPLDSGNAPVLAKFLERRLVRRPQPALADHLGRRLFVSTPSRFVPLFSATTGLIMLAFTLANPRQLIKDGVAGLFALALWGFLVWKFLPDLVSKLHVHEHGIARRGLMGWRTLRYAQVDHLRFAEVRTTDRGYYTGTNVKFQFGVDGEKPLGFDFRSTRGGEAELLELRDQVAALVAVRMKQRVKNRGSVAWTEAAALGTAGVAAKVSPHEWLSYEGFTSWSLKDGKLQLFRGGDKPALEIASYDEDFYPGRIVFEGLVPEKASARTR